MEFASPFGFEGKLKETDHFGDSLPKVARISTPSFVLRLVFLETPVATGLRQIAALKGKF